MARTTECAPLNLVLGGSVEKEQAAVSKQERPNIRMASIVTLDMAPNA
jgi:hypothetical protein